MEALVPEMAAEDSQKKNVIYADMFFECLDILDRALKECEYEGVRRAASAYKSLKTRLANNKDGENPYYIGVWVPVSMESIEAALAGNVTTIYRSYTFYNEDDPTNRQTFTVKIDLSDIILTNGEDTDPQIKVVDGEIVDMNKYFDVKYMNGEELVKEESVRYNHETTKPDDPVKENYIFCTASIRR